MNKILIYDTVEGKEPILYKMYITQYLNDNLTKVQFLQVINLILIIFKNRSLPWIHPCLRYVRNKYRKKCYIILFFKKNSTLYLGYLCKM